jgi:hypothetical protein
MAKSKKKWADLKGKLPDAPSSYGDDMLERQRTLEALPLRELADTYEAARLAAEAADEAKKLAAFEEEAAERALLNKMEREGLDSIGIKGYNYSPSLEPYPSVKDKAAFMAYALDQMPETLTVPHQSLKARCKSALEGDGEVPPGVELYLKHKFSRTKA